MGIKKNPFEEHMVLSTTLSSSVRRLISILEKSTDSEPEEALVGRINLDFRF